ncbi:hypothetical protein BKA80DRAFT_264612 [Phyllosticta citrichinensis]
MELRRPFCFVFVVVVVSSSQGLLDRGSSRRLLLQLLLLQLLLLQLLLLSSSYYPQHKDQAKQSAPRASRSACSARLHRQASVTAAWVWRRRGKIGCCGCSRR